MNQVPVVLLGGLNIMRALGLARIPVIIASSQRRTPSMASRYCAGTIALPPIHEREALVEALVRAGRRLAAEHGRAVPLFYDNDDRLALVQDHRAALAPHFALLLNEPLFYYRHHAENLWVIDAKNAEKLRRRCEMTELAFSRAYQMLIKLGVAEEAVSELLTGVWAEARRERLSKFGGTRREAFQTEMECFRANYKNPSAGYRLFKYFVVGAATLLLPARQFYKMRDWYAAKELGPYRDRVFKAS